MTKQSQTRERGVPRGNLLGLAGILLGFGLAGCADRQLQPTPEEPTVEEVCDSVCVVYDRCWTKEEGNPNSTIPECVEDCTSLYYAWPYDPEQRLDCADIILDLQWCFASLATCEEFDAVSDKPGNPCDEEFARYGGHGCIGGDDPRDYVDTETG